MSSGRTLLHVTESAFWPPYQGDAARNLAIISGLRARGWTVHVVHLHDPEQPSDYEGMRVRCDSLAVYFPTAADRAVRTGSSPDDWCPPGLVDLVAAVASKRDVDVMLAQFLFLSRCLTVAPAKAVRALDADNWFVGRKALYEAAMLPYGWFSTTEAEARAAVARAHVLLTIQREEQRRYQAIAPVGTAVECVPHPVDGSWHPQKFDGKHIAFVGNDNAENRQGLARFLAEAWPPIRARHPDATLHVVGRVGHGLAAPPGVVVHGACADLEGIYARCAYALNLADVGTGLKIKSIEALAHGCCLISTAAGVQGLTDWADAHIEVSAWTDFAPALCSVLSAPDRAKAIGLQAFRRARREHSPTAMIDALIRAISPRSDSAIEFAPLRQDI